ncbi:MAG: hypothetical protein ABIA63_13690 [bacterium]
MIRINLIRDQVIFQAPRKTGLRKFIMAFAVLAGIGGLGSGIFYFFFYKTEPAVLLRNKPRIVRKPLRHVASITAVEDVVKDKYYKRTIIRSLDRLGFRKSLTASEAQQFDRCFPKFLIEIFNNCLPSRVIFYQINIENDGTFFIHGKSPSRELAYIYKKNLELKADYIRSIETVEFPKSKKSGGVRFILKGLINFNLLYKTNEHRPLPGKFRKLDYFNNTVDWIAAKGRKLGVVVSINPGRFSISNGSRKQDINLSIVGSYSAAKELIDIIYRLESNVVYKNIILQSAGNGKVKVVIQAAIQCKK